MSPRPIICIGCDQTIGENLIQSDDPLRCITCYFQGDQKVVRR